jgi:menaquinone-dependent protoporphyrinogen oxidase
MLELLVVYASRHGHTEKIARHLADSLLGPGVSVLVATLDEAPDLHAGSFDGFAVVGSVHMADHDPHLVAWVREHRHSLQRRPSAFCSVSMAAAAGSDDAREYIDRFVEDSGWTPWRSIAVAGALQYPAYRFVTRQLVRQIAAHKGLSTDLSRETEYTDWAALEAFAERFMDRVRSADDSRSGRGSSLSGSPV